eukprot:jgi/Mesvir1/10749/Mv13818-RA.1
MQASMGMLRTCPASPIASAAFLCQQGGPLVLGRTAQNACGQRKFGFPGRPSSLPSPRSSSALHGRMPVVASSKAGAKHGLHADLASAEERGDAEAAIVALKALLKSSAATPDCCASAMATCNAAGDWPNALAVASMMDIFDIAATPRTFELQLAACQLGERPDTALDVLDKMRKQGMQVTEAAYLNAIATMRPAGRLDTAVALLRSMLEASGLGPDGDMSAAVFGRESLVAAYDIAIRAVASADQWETAYGLLRDMARAGLNDPPPRGLYDSVIGACLRGGRGDLVEELLDERDFL